VTVTTEHSKHEGDEEEGGEGKPRFRCEIHDVQHRREGGHERSTVKLGSVNRRGVEAGAEQAPERSDERDDEGHCVNQRREVDASIRACRAGPT
jgi:hypothetical protein